MREFAQFLVDFIEHSLLEYDILPAGGSLYFEDPAFEKCFFVLKMKGWDGDIHSLYPYGRIGSTMEDLSFGTVHPSLGYYDESKCLLYIRIDVSNPKVYRRLVRTGADIYATYVFCYDCRLPPDIFRVYSSQFSKTLKELCGRFDIVILMKNKTKTIQLRDDWKIDRRILSYILREI